MKFFCDLLISLDAFLLKDSHKDNAQEYSGSADAPITWWTFLCGILVTFGIGFAISEQGKGIRPLPIVYFCVLSSFILYLLWQKRFDARNVNGTGRIVGRQCFLFGLMFSVVYVFMAATGQIPGQQIERVKYEHSFIAMNDPVYARLSRKSESLSRNMTTIDKKIAFQGQWKNWLEKGLDSSLDKKYDKQVLLEIAQAGTFDSNHRQIFGRIAIKKGWKIVTGFLYLERLDRFGNQNVRPIQICQDETMETAFLILDDPCKSEAIKGWIVVEPTENEAETEKPSSTNEWALRIKVENL